MPPPGCRRAASTVRRSPSAPRGCPTPTSCAPSSTTIRSAMRTVEKRCETRIVMRPSRVLARRGGVALEQRVLGFGVERGGRFVEHQQQRPLAHEAARQRELLPLPERQLDAVRPRRPELRVESRPAARSMTSSAPARPTARRTAASSSSAARRRGRRCAARGTRSGRNPETRRRAAARQPSAGMPRQRRVVDRESRPTRARTSSRAA